MYRLNGPLFCLLQPLVESYPLSLGLEILHDIPRNVSKKDFQEWVKSTKEYLAAQSKHFQY
jgi:hypothetical protein